MSITENYKRIRAEIPQEVRIIVAAKTRTAAEIKEVILAGATDIGENYVQEAESLKQALDKDLAERICWHMIGSLQKNKINKALPIFDFIQTVDSLDLAVAIDKRVVNAGQETIPIMLEINIGSELSKSGLKPEEHENFAEFLKKLAEDISHLNHIRLEGLMTMGPFSAKPEEFRQYFRKTKDLFDRLNNLKLERINMKYLSMGMTDSYRIAIEEGANMVRIGTAIFGLRETTCKYKKRNELRDYKNAL